MRYYIIILFILYLVPAFAQKQELNINLAEANMNKHNTNDINTNTNFDYYFKVRDYSIIQLGYTYVNKNNWVFNYTLALPYAQTKGYQNESQNGTVYYFVSKNKFWSLNNGISIGKRIENKNFLFQNLVSFNFYYTGNAQYSGQQYYLDFYGNKVVTANEGITIIKPQRFYKYSVGIVPTLYYKISNKISVGININTGIYLEKVTKVDSLYLQSTSNNYKSNLWSTNFNKTRTLWSFATSEICFKYFLCRKK